MVRKCYICWEQTAEYGPCTCSAVVHHKCRFKWSFHSKKKHCTLCKGQYSDASVQSRWKFLFSCHAAMHTGLIYVLLLMFLSSEVQMIQHFCIGYITVYIVLNHYIKKE
jgi:hypothetical protein